MIPYDIDPSLHDGEPAPRRLDDGFSPPHADRTADEFADEHAEAAPPVTLGDKSPF